MKYLLFAFSAILLDVIPSCREESFDVSPDTVMFDHGGGSDEIKVSTNLKWELSRDVFWLDISPVSGSGDAKIRITAQPNESTSQRFCDIKFKGNYFRAYKEVTVYQKGNSDFLTVNPSNVLLDSRGDSAIINVSSNVKWKITGLDSWLDISPASGDGDAVIRITAQPNESTSQRYSLIFIDGNGLQTRQRVDVVQKGKLATEVTEDGR